MKEIRMRAYFFFIGQFCGCSGSSGPSNSTTYSSLSGSGGGYSLPPPKLGNGFFDSRDFRLRPTVPLCCDLCVSMRLSAVGCRSRSRPVCIRDILISSRMTGWEEDEDEDELEAPDSIRSRLPSSRLEIGNRSGDASVSALSRSRSTASMVAVSAVTVYQLLIRQ